VGWPSGKNWLGLEKVQLVLVGAVGALKRPAVAYYYIL
jgi:hypothetical protein